MMNHLNIDVSTINLSNFKVESVKMGLDIPLVNNYYHTFNLALSLGLKSCQTYIPSNNTIDLEYISDLIRTRKLVQSHPELYTCFHSNLTYNLAGSAKGSTDPQFKRKLNRSKCGLINELDTSVVIGSGMVSHIGSNKDKQSAYQIISDSINEALIVEGDYTLGLSKLTEIPLIDFKTKRKIILENSAGKGNQLGKTLDEISILCSLINPNLRDNVKVCIDTCHIFDAGQYNFDLPEETRRFYSDFNQKIGLNKLEVFHFNDSLKGFASNADRHAHLGQGKMFIDEGLKGIKHFVRHTSDLGIPLIGEYSDGNGMMDVKLVNSLLT